MAFKHGSKAAVWANGIDLSAYLTSAELSASMEPADTTTFGATWRTAIAGLLTAGYEFEGKYDPAETGIQAGFASSGVLTVCPSGSAIGDAARFMPYFTTGYGQSSPVDDAVSISWGVEANDELDFGLIIHNSEDTNTTTGPTYDRGAASSTGWSAALQVTLVDGGSWVVKLQHATASNFSDGADVSGGAFTAVTTVTAEIIRSAAATTTLNRYVRVVATRTGGSAGQGITYTLALAKQMLT